MRPFLRSACTASVCLAGVRVLVVTTALQPPAIRNYSQSMALDDSKEPTANVSIGDVDGDRDLDLVLAVGRHDTVTDRVLINDGKGRFTSKPLSDRRDPSYSAELADLDGDGDLDIVVSNDSQAKVIYSNDGKGNFTAIGEWGVATWPTRNVTIADLNGDKRPDIIAANRDAREGRRSHICLNDGSGRFPACTELAVGPATTIAAADFDRDGDIDLAAPHRNGGESLLLYNDGKAGFSRTVPFGPGTTAARAIAAGDLNGDRWPDLVLGDERVGSFVHLNDGRGGLLPALQIKFDSVPVAYSMLIADLNKDGRQDIVIGHAEHAGSVLFGDGTGRSFQHVKFGDGTAPAYGVAAGDLDGDGFADLAVVRSGAPNLIFFNRPGGAPTPLVASDQIGSPLEGLEPFGPGPAKFGVWHGRSTSTPGNVQWDVEVWLDQLEPGKPAGTARRISYGVAFCASEITLTERKTDGGLMFSSAGRAGCRDEKGTIEARWVDNNMRLQWNYSPAEVPVTATAMLERRR
jgi:hypothetical protein